ncbi:MFS general substrate transporter [Mycena albidolilacea]|uniref:MFS general substrate transporter n=1 Tax=Mycena albidolilacea TaxID=1033008 RepID=A0AAD7EG02_9AGAR|nr:MFS general substrate transporter [Mycena albidolilacea]
MQTLIPLQSNEEGSVGSHKPLTTDIVVPDGGFEAWRTIIGAWLVLFATFGYVFTFGVYEDFYAREYLANYSPSSISWIGSFQLMMPFLLGPFAGKIFDDGGFHALEISGGLIFTFSVFMLSLAKPGQYYQIFLAQAVGMGLGLGLTFVPTLGIVVHHFRRKRGLASGIALSGSSIGATIFPITSSQLINKLGFGQTIRVTGALIPPCLVLGNCLMRTRLPPRSKRAAAPKPDIKSFFREATYMWAVVGMFFSLLGLYFPIIYIQLFSVQHAVDSTLAFYSVAMMNIAGAVVRVLANHLGDLFGPFNVQLICSVCCGAIIWAMLSIRNGASLIIISLLYGAFSGAWLSLAFACFASLARTPEEVGARTGIALALVSIGVLVSAPIQGALLRDTFVWINAVAFATTMMFAGTACTAVTRTLRSRQTKDWRA